jgi:hypothetical protein
MKRHTPRYMITVFSELLNDPKMKGHCSRGHYHGTQSQIDLCEHNYQKKRAEWEAIEEAAYANQPLSWDPERD